MLGIIGAMDTEIKHFYNVMEVESVCEISGMVFYKGKICGQDVVMVKSGVGKVFAAICSQTLIYHYKPDLIINTGVGGALDPDLELLDIVIADEVLQQAVQGITDLINVPGLINLDFADVKTVMTDKGVAHIGIGTATGDDKAIEAVKQAVTSPLLETTIEGATHVIINISGDISLIEANEAASYVQELAGENANIIFGAMFDENAADTATITVIATGLEDSNVNNAMAGFSAKVQTPRQAVKPSYTYSGSASAAASTGVNAGHASTQQTASTISQSPLPGLKQPGQVTSNVKEKGINIPTFLQKTKK